MFDIPSAVGKVSDFLGGVLDKFIPDAIEREKVSLEIAQMAFKEVEMANADRADARQREMAVKDTTPMILAYSITAGFFGVLVMMAYTEIPMGAKEVLYVMIGSLGTAWTGVIAYYFGSSAGSAAKHNMIDRLTK